MQNFNTFLKELDLPKTVIGLVIGAAMTDLVKVLLDEFVKPVTDKIAVPKQKLQVFGDEIDFSAIAVRAIEVIASLLFAYVMYLVLKPRL